MINISNYKLEEQEIRRKLMEIISKLKLLEHLEDNPMYAKQLQETRGRYKALRREYTRIIRENKDMRTEKEGRKK